MAPDAAVTERVYASVKAQILRGELPSGKRLEVKRIAYDEQVSITPVRDAIHRLVGERLLEFQGHGGFQVPILSEAGLRDLYIWHLQLVRLALAHPLREVDTMSDRLVLDEDANIEKDQIVGQTERLFATLVERSSNRELRSAAAAAAERLRPVRFAELHVIERPGSEIADLHRRLMSGGYADMVEPIISYHDRRLRFVADLVELLPMGKLRTRNS